MAEVFFTPNLKRHVDCPSSAIDATTVGELFDRYFEQRPEVRHYVLDDQGHVRHNIKILVDGINLRDRRQLSDSLASSSQVHVFQALSGG
jgi:molybdopterin converting factor small subunit